MRKRDAADAKLSAKERDAVIARRKRERERGWRGRVREMIFVGK